MVCSLWALPHMYSLLNIPTPGRIPRNPTLCFLRDPSNERRKPSIILGCHVGKLLSYYQQQDVILHILLFSRKGAQAHSDRLEQRRSSDAVASTLG